MPGRNAKSIGLHLAEGNPSHLTQAEIEARKQGEVKLGENDLAKLRQPAFVRSDKAAAKFWRELIKEYKSAAKQGVELLTSSDVGMLGLYCKTFSEYEKLLNAYQTIDKIAYDSVELDAYIEDSEEFNFKVKLQLRAMIAVDGLLRIETAINKKMDMLLKMQDRLFLNPLAKVKNVPKPAKPPAKKSAMASFMERRAGGGHGP